MDAIYGKAGAGGGGGVDSTDNSKSDESSSDSNDGNNSSNVNNGISSSRKYYTTYSQLPSGMYFYPTSLHYCNLNTNT